MMPRALIARDLFIALSYATCRNLLLTQISIAEDRTFIAKHPSALTSISLGHDPLV